MNQITTADSYASSVRIISMISTLGNKAIFITLYFIFLWHQIIQILYSILCGA